MACHVPLKIIDKTIFCRKRKGRQYSKPRAEDNIHADGDDYISKDLAVYYTIEGDKSTRLGQGQDHKATSSHVSVYSPGSYISPVHEDHEAELYEPVLDSAPTTTVDRYYNVGGAPGNQDAYLSPVYECKDITEKQKGSGAENSWKPPVPNKYAKLDVSRMYEHVYTDAD